MKTRLQIHRDFRVYAAEVVEADLKARLPFLSTSIEPISKGGPPVEYTSTSSTLFPLMVVRARVDAGLYEDMMGLPPPTTLGSNLFVPVFFDGGETKLPAEFFEALAGAPDDTKHISFVGSSGSVQYAEMTF